MMDIDITEVQRKLLFRKEEKTALDKFDSLIRNAKAITEVKREVINDGEKVEVRAEYDVVI